MDWSFIADRKSTPSNIKDYKCKSVHGIIVVTGAGQIFTIYDIEYLLNWRRD